nr:glycosyl hydrolase [uncultured Draconibacterium sp.]
MKSTILFILAVFCFSCQSQKTKTVLSEEEFKNPSAEYKPRTWFHAMSGNMSKAGLTKDLEAIEKVGIGGILLFNVTQGIPNGPIKYNSPEHHEMLTHAAAECERLGLSFGVHNCDGWSSSGGPWITPEQSMKMVVWSETIASGGDVNIQLLQPTTRKGYYEDIAVLAYPSLKTEIADFENPPKITASDPNFDIKIASDNRWDETTRIEQSDDNNPWIQFEYDKPHEIRSVFMVFNREGGEAVLQVSEDGRNFESVRELYKVRTGKTEDAINDSFDALKSKYFRIQLNKSMSFKEVRLLSTRCLHNVLGRTSMARTEDHEMTPIGSPEAEMIIDKSKLINLTEKMNSKGKLQASLPEGSWTIMRFGYTTTDAFNHPASDEGRGLECDKFSREAFKFHYDAFSKKVIENTKDVAPNAMQYIEIDSYEMGGQNWTQNYDTIFRNKKGYDIISFLPLFTGRFIESAESSDKVLWDIRDINCQLMDENYFGYFAELCHKDGIKSYIEPYGFGPLNDLDVGKRADINMGEFWMNREMTMVQSAVSASHIYGKNVISAESFTSTPQINWKGNPAMAKISGDLAWTHGINEFMFHRFAHQANTHVKPGMTMHRWGFHFDRTQTWWANAGADWFKYMARGQYMLRQGVPVSDLLVFIGDGSPNSVFLRKDFEPEIPSGTNFDCVNTDVLVNRIQLKNNKLVLPEGTAYKALVLRNCETLTMETLQRIQEISKAGIPIVGPKPQLLAGYSNSEQNKNAFIELANKIWSGEKVYTDYNWSKMMNAENIDSDFNVFNRDDISFIHRSLQGEDIYFFFNPDSVLQQFECSFRVEGKIPELWDPMTGETHKTAQFKNENGKTKVWINLDAEESVFVVFRESSDGVPTVSEAKELKTDNFVLNAQNELQQETLSNEKPLEIDGSWGVEFLKEHDYQATHTFHKLADWKNSSVDEIKYYSGTAIYRKSFSVDESYIKENNKYILDLGDVKIVAEVKLNGSSIGVDWMPPFELEITEHLKAGENELEIEITNQWSNKLIGDERFPASYTGYKLEGNFPKGIMMDWYANNEPMPAGKRTTFCTASFYKADDELMPSGLLGPVQIKTEKVKIINN